MREHVRLLEEKVQGHTEEEEYRCIREVATGAITTFLHLHPPSPHSVRNSNLAPLWSLIDLREVYGTLLIPLWNQTPEFKSEIKFWGGKQWAAFRALIQALAPVLKVQSDLFNSQYPELYFDARHVYLSSKSKKKPKSSPAHPHLPKNNCFSSIRISANLSLDTAPLDAGNQGKGTWGVMLGLGEAQVKVHIPRIDKQYELKAKTSLSIRPNVEVKTMYYEGLWYMLELYLPYWEKEDYRIPDETDLTVGW